MKAAELFRKYVHYFNLETELDSPEIIHEEIEKGVLFKGTNLWILVFAIIIASLGLNMNSTAVIIGAMLISPLMGPINGIGYSVATYDMDLFKRSLKSFGYEVVVSLVASTAYFALSPVSTAHSELLARTSPTIYDVLIALFGGLAGIVAISSKQKGNVIPGVAIATALMPPLCTAGYGLATGQIEFFLGAFYLFTINSVFIAIASVSISQILKFPIRSNIENTQKRRINRVISAVIVVVLLPSIYFGYRLVQKEQFREKANTYISDISTYEGNYLLNSEVNPDNNSILLVYGGLDLTEEQKSGIREKSSLFGLKNAEIIVKQGLSFEGISEKNLEMVKLREELNKVNTGLKAREFQLDSIKKRTYYGQAILNEVKVLFPQISSCTYAESAEFNDTTKVPQDVSLVYFKTTGLIDNNNKEKINEWIKRRLSIERLKVIYE